MIKRSDYIHAIDSQRFMAANAFRAQYTFRRRAVSDYENAREHLDFAIVLQQDAKDSYSEVQMLLEEIGERDE